VTTIALHWGFNDPAHFSRAFRRRYATTPTRFRARMSG
jgi:AraC-like DNA-binding protein